MSGKGYNKNKYGRSFSALLFFMSLTLLFFTGCSDQVGGEPIMVAEAGIKALEVNVRITNNLSPDEPISISAKMGGKVREVNFQVGDSVSKGQTLVVLDTTELEARLDAAKKNYEGALAKTKTAKEAMDGAAINLERMQALYDEGAVALIKVNQARSEYDSARQVYNRANNTLTQAKTSVDGVLSQLANANVTSPISGLIVSKDIGAGEVASPGVSIGAVADISKLKLKGSVEHDLFPFIEEDQVMEVTVDQFPENVYEGNITRLGPITVGSGNYYPIEITIDNPGELTVGMKARTGMTIIRDLGIVVPSSAIVEVKGQMFLYVVQGEVVHRRPVELGFSNGDDVEIARGIKQGEMVAISNVHKLKDNMRVNLSEE
ncbi:MAG: efflux RND transporter periplasmic adaptor subunit [Anaerovoracaceae bacterium]|jgi:RND family efflux transporter MFP subunit